MPTLTDVDWIFVILAALYVAESVVWIRTGSVGFVYSHGRLQSPLSALGLIGNEHGQLTLAGLLPGSAILIAQPAPVSVSPEGVLGFVAASALSRQRDEQPGRWQDWAACERLNVVDRQIVDTDRELFVRVVSHRLAHGLKSELVDLAHCRAKRRPGAIHRWYQAQFDVQQTRDRIAAWIAATARLSFAANLLLVWIFPVGLAYHWDLLPIAYGYRSLAVYLAVALVLWWWIVGETFIAHARLYPGRRASRWRGVLVALLSPPAALRARNMLARELFDFVHPIAVASAGPIDRDTLHELLGSVVRDLKYPKLPDEPQTRKEPQKHREPLTLDEPVTDVSKADVRPPDESNTDELLEAIRGAIGYHRQECLEQCASICEQHQWSLDTFLAQPEFSDTRTLSYCPRCLSEYHVAQSTCPPCGHRPSIPLGS